MKLSKLVAMAAATVVAAYAPPTAGAPQGPAVCVDCIKANMQALAGDELRGRGCGTADENAAATYVANTLNERDWHNASPRCLIVSYSRSIGMNPLDPAWKCR